jgi:tetratricopeptide (TPR) repeat protein
MNSPLLSLSKNAGSNPSSPIEPVEGWEFAKLCAQLGKFKASFRIAQGIQKENDNQSKGYQNHLVETVRLAAEFSEEIGDYLQAADYWDKTTRISPQDASAWHGLGLAKANLQDYYGAIQALQRGLQYEPSNLKIKLSLAEIQQCLPS